MGQFTDAGAITVLAPICAKDVDVLGSWGTPATICRWVDMLYGTKAKYPSFDMPERVVFRKMGSRAR